MEISKAFTFDMATAPLPSDPIPARSRRAILELLKAQGPSLAVTLARALKVTTMAARQHLYALQEQKLVTFAEEVTGVGRPRKRWRLTAAAERLFPDAHAELAVALLEGVRRSFGATGLEKLMRVRSEQQVEAYRWQLDPLQTLAAKVRALARLRTREGYMAKAVKEPDGAWSLVENHCPVCSAAQTCAGLCQAELTVFQTVLGSDVELERSEHILGGSRRCVYRIKPAR